MPDLMTSHVGSPQARASARVSVVVLSQVVLIFGLVLFAATADPGWSTSNAPLFAVGVATAVGLCVLWWSRGHPWPLRLLNGLLALGFAYFLWFREILAWVFGWVGVAALALGLATCVAALVLGGDTPIGRPAGAGSSFSGIWRMVTRPEAGQTGAWVSLGLLHRELRDGPFGKTLVAVSQLLLVASLVWIGLAHWPAIVTLVTLGLAAVLVWFLLLWARGTTRPLRVGSVLLLISLVLASSSIWWHVYAFEGARELSLVGFVSLPIAIIMGGRPASTRG